MTKERELLRRALEDWDFSDKFETLDPIFEDIRTYLSTSDDAEEPVEFKFIPTGKELLRYHPDEDCIETKVEFANYPAGSKFYPPKPAEPEAEPVGYAVKMIPRGLHFIGFVGEEETEEEIEDYGPDQIVPLYTKPVEPAARKPMTEEEISKLFPTMPTEYEAGFREGIRFAEKHHGIGGDDES